MNNSINKDVVVVIATYNEANSIEKLLKELYNYRVIVVDDNSPDGTGEIARRFGVRVITRPRKMGIASAYITGFKKVFEYKDIKYIVQIDAGFTHDPGYITKMLEVARDKESDLVIGSRFIYPYRWLSYRTFISRTASILMGCLWGNKVIYDVTSGFRVWNIEVLRFIEAKFKVRSTGFAFQLELLYYCKVNFLGIVDEVKIPYVLSNSTFNFKMLLEAIWIYIGLVLRKR